MMLTPKFWGILKKKTEMFQEIEVQKLRERWCAYNDNEKAKNNLYINTVFIARALSKTLQEFWCTFIIQHFLEKSNLFPLQKNDFLVQVP